MNIPVNSFTWLVSLLPILVLLVLMLKCRFSAAEAAPAGLLTAIVSALLVFRADLPLIAMDCAKGLWSTLAIFIVIWPAILIYEVSNQSGSTGVFLAKIRSVSPNELLQILVVGAVFPSFLQGITGFGVPVAVGASLLLAMGIRPVEAVIIPLLGQAWGGTFGTLAVAWDALATQAQLAQNPALLLRTALYSGVFIWLWNLLSLLLICWVYGRAEGLKKGLPAVLVLSLLQGGGELVTAQFNQTLAAFLPCCLALLAVFLLGKTRWYCQPWQCRSNAAIRQNSQVQAPQAAAPANLSIHQAFLPYYILTGLTLTVLLVQPVYNLLSSWKIGFAFPTMQTSYGFISPAASPYAPIAPLTHAGLFLFISALAGYAYFRAKGRLTKADGREIFLRSLGKSIPSGIAVAGFIMMSRVMSGSGQTMVLAYGISEALGSLYALFTPFVGMLGSFITSSTMASNILFGEFQSLTAGLLQMDPAPILAAQTAGASIGNAIAPGSIILGATTAGILGSEGKVLTRMIPFALTGTVLIGLILWAMTALGG